MQCRFTPLFSLLLFLLSCATVHAQDIAAEGDVVIRSDPRLAVLVRKTHAYVRPTMPEQAKPVELPPPPPPIGTYTTTAGIVHREQRATYKGRGYRVQIYSGPSREKAMAVKTDFMRRFPGVRTYVVFDAPSFRVRIGDYRMRGDAEGMLREANSMFTPSMIVPEEQVTISTY